ncbi:sensor histidine kinase [Nocardia anaemiae]|uniref:sensor histidine kinase n=1 Tax=Nocardia anaemiae TaxID=263910 RepID=UPI0007A3C0C6|nr:nitrate- and nitrite sensing domain-containing protein [Nocardia anaemiae]
MFKTLLSALLTARARILAIALIPSVALCGLGIAGGWILVDRGVSAKNWSAEIEHASTPGFEFISGVQQERERSLLRLAGGAADPTSLQEARHRVDGGWDVVTSAGHPLEKVVPGTTTDIVATVDTARAGISALRSRVDVGSASVDEVDQFYTRVAAIAIRGTSAVTTTAPDTKTATNLAIATRLADVAEAMSHSNALGGLAAIDGRLAPDLFAEFNRLIGFYHTEAGALETELASDGQKRMTALTSGAAWQNLSRMEEALIQYGTGSRGDTESRAPSVPFDLASWQSAATAVNNELLGIWVSQVRSALSLAADAGQRMAYTSLLAAVAIVVVAVIAFAVALALSNRLIRRLRRLRTRTLALADEELPRLLWRLEAGESVDVAAEPTELDFGRDEIGEVAEAFGRAYGAAVSATVAETRTREGVRAVFLNIAHRSQMVVHQQLALLDRAEERQEDPALLELLFKLDQLATRERRNAENLIILGGDRPGRKWRNPVTLLEIVRSAIGETEGFARVSIGRLPEVMLLGSVVADLVHLLAELVDNANAFSPPESRIEVSGNVVGKGVAVEVLDQGLGMTTDQMERINAALSDAPDFGVAEISSESRLGMFVVARLAARHDIGVRLAESDYGGIRAVVLIPTKLVAKNRDTETVDAEIVRSNPATLCEPPHGGVRVVGHQVIAAVEQPWSQASGPSVDRARHRQHATKLPESQQVHAQGEVAEAAWYPDDGRPPLPRRRRQDSLAPELANHGVDSESAAPVLDPAHSPERARSIWAAIDTGTRQGRRPAGPGHGQQLDQPQQPRGSW